jgi:hypothetical protein
MLHGQQNIKFTTHRVQTVQQYAVIRSVKDGLGCNFVHSDDILFNIFNVGGTESWPGHRVSYKFSDNLLKILITRNVNTQTLRCAFLVAYIVSALLQGASWVL